jgi:DMSO/TMAO reductase YedYZ molybdopterin-dependent catalytic subunit
MRWQEHPIRRRQLLGGLGALAVTTATTTGTASAGRAFADEPPPILKPLPPELFIVHGTNAEMRWEAMAGQGSRVPVDRFFVRNHTRTPTIDQSTWRLQVEGGGLRDPKGTSFTLGDLRKLPSHQVTAFIECAGNGRSFYASQQGTPATGTPWLLGGIGLATWRGVKLSTVLQRAGLTKHAVDVMPEGLDPTVVSGGQDLGHVRRPLPISKALDDVLIAYEMNGRPLLPDHGFPARLVVPNWVGIASVKWLGRIQVSTQPLSSPWNTQLYRLFGPSYPPEGSPPLTNQVTKSAFELPWDATFRAGRTHVLTGRAWSGTAKRIRRVEVSTDDGRTWRRAQLRGRGTSEGWQEWHAFWRPEGAGAYNLMARATDEEGHAQPPTTPFNTQGYLFDAVVRHPVVVVA